MGKLNRAGRGGGGGGGGARGATEIPPHQEPPVTGGDVAQATTRREQFFDVVFRGRNPQGLADPSKTWSYRGVFRTGHRQDDIRTFVTALAYYRSGGANGKGLSGIDPSPVIRVYSEDGPDADSNPDFEEVPFRSVEIFSEEDAGGADGADETGAANSLLPPDSSSADIRTRFEETRRWLKKRLPSIDDLIALLLSCGFDMLGIVQTLEGMKARMIAGDTAGAVALVRHDLNERRREVNDALVEELRKSPSDSAGQADRLSRIEELRYQQSQIASAEPLLEAILSETMQAVRMQEDAAQSLQSQRAQLASRANIWT